ncbi:DUF2303 family protein [Pseudomonas tohonis]|nr:hypothetical protein L682_11135 [Pseudomonas alcaligenes OT 69]MDN4148727.1 DUF2303 family protein [Pseudomonas tohonis]
MQSTLNHLLSLAQALGKPLDHPGLATPISLLPDDVKVESLEHLLPAPTRTKVSRTLLDAASFIEYANRFKSPATSLFCNGPDERGFKAIFDYHQPGQPAWGDHTALYVCPTTTEWSRWLKANRQPFEQADFAAFIEDNIKDIVVPPEDTQAPSAADMLEISRTLSAQKNLQFRQGVRLDNGAVQFTFNEEINGQAGNAGQLSIPEQFYIGVKPFLGGDTFCIPARFRWRITDKQALSIRFELVRPDKVLEMAYSAVREQIQKGLADVPMYESKF